MPVALLVFATLPASYAAPPLIKVQPRVITNLLANPGMGWQTFHRFADQDPNLDGLPSGSAYFRFYWREIEPRAGAIGFARFDALLAHARRVGQKLSFRIMCTGSSQYLDVPAWLKAEGCRGVEFTYGGRKHWVPDFADPLFQEKHFRLIRELGRHYDGHPDLGLVDIGSVGLWGEWHMSGTAETHTGRPVPLPPLAIRLAIIEAWCRAFPRTPKVVQIGCTEGMERAARLGCGWRADCLGDLGGFSKTWNHMRDFYPQQLAKTHALNVWKTGPVAFESCWDMRKWKAEGWDIPFIFDFALRHHASYFNNKSAPLPPGTRREIDRFLRQLGYRLVLRTLEHPRSVRAGTPLAVAMDWDNLGVAPPYRDDRVAIRLRPDPAGSARPILGVTGPSIRGWLPGRRTVRATVPVPPGTPPGDYQLAVGVVDPVTGAPEVRLAIAEGDAQGWYALSHVLILP